MGIDVLLGQPLGRSGKPRLDNELFQFVDADPVEAHEDRRVPVKVRRCEVDARLIGEKRFFRTEVLDTSSQDRSCRRRLAEGAEVRRPQRPLPDEPFGAHPPEGETARGLLAGFRQIESNSTHILPARSSPAKASSRSVLGHSEYWMIRRDPEQLVLRGVGPDAGEERPDLEFPLL